MKTVETLFLDQTVRFLVPGMVLFDFWVLARCSGCIVANEFTTFSTHRRREHAVLLLFGRFISTVAAQIRSRYRRNASTALAALGPRFCGFRSGRAGPLDWF